MDAEKIFLTGLAVAICTLIISIAVHNIHEDGLVGDAIMNGADPIAARCGFDPRMDVCIINETQSK